MKRLRGCTKNYSQPFFRICFGCLLVFCSIGIAWSADCDNSTQKVEITFKANIVQVRIDKKNLNFLN